MGLRANEWDRWDGVEGLVPRSDLRGLFALDDKVAPGGYKSLNYTVRIKGDGTPEQFAKIHEMVKATSPNYYNLSQPVQLNAELVIE